MNEPSEKLKNEIMDYIFNYSVDHNECLKVWHNNPWEAVSQYEIAVYPDMLMLPLAIPGKVKPPPADADIDALAKGRYYVEKSPRAPEGEYELGDGTVAKINMFGRVLNSDEIYGNDEY